MISSGVDIFPVRDRLEALSFDTLRKMAKQEGVDVPDGVAKILLIDLLLEVLEDKLEEQDLLNNDSVRLQQLKYDVSYIDAAGEGASADESFFPAHYNETRIVLMLRDPFWAFAYWDIKGGTLRYLKKEHEADNVLLRVLRLKRSESRGDGGPVVLDSFDIPIGAMDSSWYVNIPEQGASYCVELILQGKTWERPLIRSNIIAVPEAVYADSFRVEEGTPLNRIIALSEIDKLDVSSSRQSIPQRISSPQTAQFLDPR
jgi:hypothetical protein